MRAGLPPALAALLVVTGATAIAQQADPAAQIDASLRNGAWHRLSVYGTAPQRGAVYIDRASLGPGVGGSVRFVMMRIDETADDGANRFVMIYELRCAELTSRAVYLRAFAPDGRVTGDRPYGQSFSRAGLNSVFALLVEPVCKNKWSKVPSARGTAEMIAGSAFAK